MDYIENQERWIEENNIKLGDKVIVTRKAKTDENGWDDYWVGPQMDGMIGKEYEIEFILSINGIKLDGFNFPYFVLEKHKAINLPNHLFEI